MNNSLSCDIFFVSFNYFCPCIFFISFSGVTCQHL